MDYNNLWRKMDEMGSEVNTQSILFCLVQPSPPNLRPNPNPKPTPTP